MASDILGVDVSKDERATMIALFNTETFRSFLTLVRGAKRNMADQAITEGIERHEYNRGYYECLDDIADLQKLD